MGDIIEGSTAKTATLLLVAVKGDKACNDSFTTPGEMQNNQKATKRALTTANYEHTDRYMYSYVQNSTLLIYPWHTVSTCNSCA